MSKSATRKVTKKTAPSKTDSPPDTSSEQKQISPEQQAAIDVENARFQDFQNSSRLQYLQARVAELVIENQSLRETIEALQIRLQRHEDESGN